MGDCIWETCVYGRHVVYMGDMWIYTHLMSYTVVGDTTVYDIRCVYGRLYMGDTLCIWETCAYGRHVVYMGDMWIYTHLMSYTIMGDTIVYDIRCVYGRHLYMGDTCDI